MKLLIRAIIIFCVFIKMSFAEQAKQYKIIEKITDNIEIRAYEELILATVTNIKPDGEDDNFRVLFKFISGGNQDQQKINMTSPVLRQKIANKNIMSFIMPDDLILNNIAKPNNNNIKIHKLTHNKFIVIRFSGRASNKNFILKEQILLNEVQKNGFQLAADKPIWAYYNAPWVLPFLKRNEVLFKLK